ncbi:mechanosensitive ion channel family protein [Mumia sp. ZJ1417]|uniref:mechanosensitive ion channel family protein n=1 Tax=Mumia sp. ZJ1417 TaxID=2708082 RepID=UPI00141E2CAA|nr:mechanosensitive ion channel family protein [Mumia sp. ZJ1417]QMW65231.1 mechanosensitive ion channel family protein [Mumia sp. ZJ1417]
MSAAALASDNELVPELVPEGLLSQNCWQDPDHQVCSLVHRWTDNDTLAELADLLLAKPMAILLLILGGVAARWLINRVIDRVTRSAAAGTVPGARAAEAVTPLLHERREQRAKSMGSLLKNIATIVIFTVVTFMVIATLGYNIAPLLASAGILGVALGFGAQSLVKDFISGIFMILEDQYGVGDVVDLGDAVGTVEAVSMRVTRLRDVNGTVWYVRNGEILRVGNQSQNWARTVLDIPVGYDVDLRRVREVLHEVAHALWQDPEWSGAILEEPEVWGVERWTAEGVVVRVVLKTAPLKQWEVAREMRELIKDRFDTLHIDIPYAHAAAYGAPPQVAPEPEEDPEGDAPEDDGGPAAQPEDEPERGRRR